MDVREKLVELMQNVRSRSSAWDTNKDVADYLIAHGVTVQEWISVKDRLPEDSTYVLARLSGGVIYQALCLTKGSKQWYAANLERFVNKDTVTHWMLLPQPPKGE